MFEYLGASIEVPTPCHTSLRDASSTKSKRSLPQNISPRSKNVCAPNTPRSTALVGVLTQSVLYLLTLDVGRSVVAATPTFSNNCRNIVSSPRFCASAHVAPQIVRRQRNWFRIHAWLPLNFSQIAHHFAICAESSSDVHLWPSLSCICNICTE
jgi:hypothetical protein